MTNFVDATVILKDELNLFKAQVEEKVVDLINQNNYKEIQQYYAAKMMESRDVLLTKIDELIDDDDDETTVKDKINYFLMLFRQAWFSGYNQAVMVHCNKNNISPAHENVYIDMNTFH